MEKDNLKEEIYEKAKSLGANLIRSCSVSKWEEEPIQKPEYWPQNSWPWVKNVIVLGIPLFARMNVCPVGEDLKKFRGTKIITQHGIKHAQAHGS